MGELMRQAARMQRKIEQAKEAAGTQEVTGTAVGDKVKATVTYARKVVRIEIDKETLGSEETDLVLDGVCAAINQGIEQADKQMETELEKVTGGVKIPGML